MKRVALSLLTVLLVLGAGVTSYYLRGLSSLPVTQINSYKMDDGPYVGQRLTIVESISSVPKEIEVSYSANVTVSVYVMTMGAYNRLGTRTAPPQEYLAKHEGFNGTLTYTPGEGNKIHVVAFYSEDSFFLLERQVNARYYSDSRVDLPTLWTLNWALIVAALASSAWSLSVSWRLREEDQ